VLVIEPSVATPNNQAALLFLLTCAIAPISRLLYIRVIYMALPYTIVLAFVGLVVVYCELLESTEWLYQQSLIEHHSATEQLVKSSTGNH
jgi:NhaB family Na+:H+ antiporter